MAIIIRRGLMSPTNDCIKQTTMPVFLLHGPACERTAAGLPAFDPFTQYPEGYGDGYVQFSNEGTNPTTSANPNPTNCAPGSEFRGYHRFTLTEFLAGSAVGGGCVTPYSREVLGAGGLNAVIVAREAQLISATGQPVQLLRRQYTGQQCPCYSLNRGRSRARCPICYGTSFVPGYIPYINDTDPLGRIQARFNPYVEDLPQREQGIFQDVQVTGWVMPTPEIRKRDVFIVYNVNDGTEEFRYEIINVTRNDTFQGITGVQLFTCKRIDVTDPIYSYDPLAIPNLVNEEVHNSDLEDAVGPIRSQRIYDRLGYQNEEAFERLYVEGPYGDGAFSGMFAQGYKQGYEINFIRAMHFQEPMFTPDFNEDGLTDEAYGPTFYALTGPKTGERIQFSTPQHVAENSGINPLEVFSAEQIRFFIQGWICGCQHALQDAENELVARRLET